MIPFLHPDRLVPELVDGMNAYVAFLAKTFTVAGKTPPSIVVHDDFAATGHVTDSAHYRGEAVDFDVVGVRLTDAWLALERFPAFRGVGFYPDWKRKGFHADVRKDAMRARWMRRGEGAYVAFDRQALALMLALESKTA